MFDVRSKTDISKMQLTVEEPLNFLTKVLSLQSRCDKKYIRFLENKIKKQEAKIDKMAHMLQSDNS
jgi:hypothetical protein